MRASSWVALPASGLLLAGLVATGACARLGKTPLPGEATAQRTFAGDSYINAGATVHLIVDVRASRIAGPQEFLPLQVALLNRSKETLRVTRESFTLETPGRTRLPVASYAEFAEDYPRHRVDLRVGREFIESLRGRYPEPPFRWRGLEFFPLKESGDVPRDEIELRQGEMAVGFVYFRLPGEDLLAAGGRCALLTRPARGADEQFVVDLVVYRDKTLKKMQSKTTQAGRP